LIVGFLGGFSAFGLSLGNSKPYARVLISSDGAKLLQTQTEEPTIIDYYKEHPFLKSRFEIEKLEDLPENEQLEIRVKPQVYGAKSGNSHDPTPSPQVIIRPISTRQPQYPIYFVPITYCDSNTDNTSIKHGHGNGNNNSNTKDKIN
ncbi:hypothetical protein TCAL_16439, partial [Tigriopus californicus]